MFGSLLISTAHCRILKTFEGKFNHRDAARICVSANPRMFTRTVEGRQFGYDVTILMDCSGSMGDFPADATDYSTIAKAYETLIILAEALHSLPDINLEILAFTADNKYAPGMASSEEDSCNNQIFVLKSFSNPSVGSLPYFPSYHTEYRFSCDNFDIGAIKVASRRLRIHSAASGNRGIMLCLSDGQPSSDISSGTELLKSYVEDLSKVHPILGIGLENPAIDRCYPGGINIKNLSDLSGQVFQDIRIFLNKTAGF
jgi:hypothetical protein